VEGSSSPLKPGYTLDRYELLCPIASGGMAAVWLARMRGKRGFEKLFAIKTIRGELVDDPRFEQMFLDEARIASAIQHPNVSHILDLGEKSGILYIVMEYIDGESLAKIRKFAAKKGAKVPLGVTLRVLADACAGLHAAHELKNADGSNMGVVHRDVSPQNLLVSTSGATKVIDFGIAKAENRGAPRTRTGIVKGKMQYMAPEQARGAGGLDRRVDVWAIGICLYELVGEKLPFDGDNPLEILQQLAAGAPAPPIPGLPEPIARLLEHTLVHDRDKRLASCAALRRGLENAIVMLDVPATSDEVAGFVEEQMPERRHERDQIVAQALKDAAERQAEGIDAYTGTVEVMSTDGRPAASSGRTKVAGKARAGVTSAVAVLEGKELSNPTLGSASLAAAGVPTGASGGRVLAWLVAIVAVCAAVYMWRGRQIIARLSPLFASTATPSTLAADGGAPVDASAMEAPLASAPASALDAAPGAVDAGARDASLAPDVSAPPADAGAPDAHGKRGRLRWPKPEEAIDTPATTPRPSPTPPSIPVILPTEPTSQPPPKPEQENPY
jgi:tRNA A-37 threonylcarbamoyl transferase component Bud32